MPNHESTSQATLENAFAHCRRIALGHYENFPVGSLLIPRAVRPHVYSVYAFARAADDFADEGHLSKEERLGQLASWRNNLEKCETGNVDHPVFIALGETINTHRLPLQLFHDLLDAFELDVQRSRHETFEALLNYSRCSANPIGRLMLLIFGFRDEALHQLSDCICTALQLTNFWQDILIDLEEKNRMYIPLEEMHRFGYSEEEFRRRSYSPSYITMMESLAERTQQLFDEGKPLCRQIPGRLGMELKLVWHGGTTVLEALRQIRFDIFTQRPVIGTGNKVRILLTACLP